ncbi:MAG: nuclear transport factor 2 family protein [Verrucomicrobia bacterium]|nr:nuclear transport factor 2 family protein [Verrucomicrobiota bacterium]
MKTGLSILLAALLGSAVAQPLPAQDGSAAELSAVAERYVAAYNAKKIDDILALFSPSAEMLDEIDGLSASGPDEIRAIFESSFGKFPDRKISLEVGSVREIATNVVIEEGIARFSGEVPNEEGAAVAYAATLVKDPEKGWLIASSREIALKTPEPDPMTLLPPLAGEWVMQGEQMRMELVLDYTPSGRALIGSAFITTPAEGTMETEIRIGYDASVSQIRWWTFDDVGGFAQGTWQPLEDGSWLVRTNGVTADGETTSAIQTLKLETEDVIQWNSTHRFMNGESLPDSELRLARRPPAPTLSLETETPPAETPAPSGETAPSNPQ